MGANAQGVGGFGIKARDLSESQARDIFSVGRVVGYTVASLEGSPGKYAKGRARLAPTKPFTVLPDFVFDADVWLDILAGRWGGMGRDYHSGDRELHPAHDWRKRP